MRFKLETNQSLPPEATPLVERVMAVSSDGIGGPFNMLLKTPKTGSIFVDMLDHFNGGHSHLCAQSRRLTVLLLAHKAGSKYAWWTHQRRALKASEFTQEQLDALNASTRPTDLSAKLSCVYDYVIALSGGTPTPADTLKALREQMPEPEIVDLIVLCGTYSTVAMLLNEADVKLPDDEVDTLKTD